MCVQKPNKGSCYWHQSTEYDRCVENRGDEISSGDGSGDELQVEYDYSSNTLFDFNYWHPSSLQLGDSI